MGLIGAIGAIAKFLRLTFLRPVERFLAQVISISTEPTAFVRERIHLGDTTNFFRAAGFFVSAISSAFLAEVATLYLLDIGNLMEPYFWLFILLTSIPFVLFFARQACCTAIVQGCAAPLVLPHRCGSFYRRCHCASGIGGCQLLSAISTKSNMTLPSGGRCL
jgi:hypothetical protein